MDIHAATEFATQLRNLVRRADRFGYDRSRLVEELLFIAENYDGVAERVEREMIDQMFVNEDAA